MSNENDTTGLLDRDSFRKGVFERDGYRCVICKATGVRMDAHHIIERRLWDDGGYYLDNGATLCDEPSHLLLSDPRDRETFEKSPVGCHMLAEQTVLTCDRIREAAGIKKVVIPEHLYRDLNFDKWGNILHPDGSRTKGELFYDESVQKVLRAGGVLDAFRAYVKYPRTYHLPWSPGLTDDDRMLPSTSVFEGREVVITEKMDGECLAAKTWITMGDGSRRSIRDLVINNAVGLTVLGKTTNGDIVETKITKTYNNGPSDDWLRVQVKGKHSSFHSIYCTPQELFYVPGQGYVPATQVNGSPVELIESFQPLTRRQEQLLLGKLLGDGSLHINRNRDKYEDHNRQSALVQWSHKAEHEEYVYWFMNALGSFAGSINRTNIVSGYGTRMKKAWTKSSHAIYRSFYDSTTRFPKSLDQFSPLSLAVFFMDDGSLTHSERQRDRIQFSVCDYTEYQCDLLIAAFSRLGVTATRKFYDYWYLIVDADNTEILSSLIAQYIPPVMQYKLPAAYRGRYIAMLDDESTSIEYYIREVMVVGVDQKVPLNQRIKYDLETETHNFFANGVLVHNCTTLYRDYMHARSLEEEHHESRGWVKKLHAEICYQIPEGWRICGENLYALHSIPYPELSSYFQVFSIWDENNTCLSWDDTVLYAGVLGLETVKVVARGTWDEDAVRKLGELVHTDRTEGFVVRLAAAFPYGSFRKSIAKWVRPNHVQTTHNWKMRSVVKNGLRYEEKSKIS